MPVVLASGLRDELAALNDSDLDGSLRFLHDNEDGQNSDLPTLGNAPSDRCCGMPTHL